MDREIAIIATLAMGLTDSSLWRPVNVGDGATSAPGTDVSAVLSQSITGLMDLVQALAQSDPGTYARALVHQEYALPRAVYVTAVCVVWCVCVRVCASECVCSTTPTLCCHHLERKSTQTGVASFSACLL